MIGSQKFKETYKKLNASQREAVDAIEGPVMVVAGPGTGKTQILALRIANILRRTDTAPEQVLALTFTEASVAAMRARLQAVIGVTAYRVPVFTFHGFCNEVIARFPEHFPELVGSRPASPLDHILLMQRVFDGEKLEHMASLRSPYHYVNKTITAISLLKREAVDPTVLRARLCGEEEAIKNTPDYRHLKGAHRGKVKAQYLKREEDILKNRELALLYEGYEMTLADERMYDYDDMILEVLRRLQANQNLRLIMQEEYQYLLADEYQDGNGAQNKVLELLASFHQSPNIFIVGDENQAIYRFQGASHENFEAFGRQYPEAKIITLTDNYRSTQTILDAGYALLSSQNSDNFHQSSGHDVSRRLMARSEHAETQIKILECEASADEAEVIATNIAQKIKEGTRPEEIAIFTRTNKELSLYASALARKTVPVAVQRKEDILDDPLIEKLLILLRAVSNVGEDSFFIQALHLDCFAVDELAIYELAREAVRVRTPAWKIPAGKEIDRVRKLILSWAKLGHNSAPAELLSTILRESGLLEQFLKASDAENRLDKLALLFSYLEDFTRTHRSARLPEISKLLTLLDEYNVLETKGNSHTVGKVQLSTAHRAKGLEFEHVYIVGAVEGNWGGRSSRTTFKLPGLVASSKEEEEADERHLFYVALTRAKKELSISYAKTRDDGTALLPSHFLELIPQPLVHKTALCTQGSLVYQAEQLLTTVPVPRSRSDLAGFVQETLLEQGLAVTGLNNYLSCPWKYFYRNLLRVPEPQTVPLMFGNAVHRSLKGFFDAYAQNEDWTREQLLARLGHDLERESFTDKELNKAREEGTVALCGYYDAYKGSWHRVVKNEFPVEVLFPVGDIDLRLTGKLDKFELDIKVQPSERLNLDVDRVRVVDYKTGKPKTRNFIEGKTKEEGSGDYKRQLVFYKLLLDRRGAEVVPPEGGATSASGGRWRMETGVIDFVVPDDKGRYHREEFTITHEEVVELETTVQRVAQEILTLSFWNKRCNDKECQYCKLRSNFV